MYWLNEIINSKSTLCTGEYWLWINTWVSRLKPCLWLDGQLWTIDTLSGPQCPPVCCVKDPFKWCCKMSLNHVTSPCQFWKSVMDTWTFPSAVETPIPGSPSLPRPGPQDWFRPLSSWPASSTPQLASLHASAPFPLNGCVVQKTNCCDSSVYLETIQANWSCRIRRNMFHLDL